MSKDLPPAIIRVGQQQFTLLFPDLLRPLSDHERTGLKADIQARGVVVPVLVDESLGVIDGGHRLTLAAELGLEAIPMEIHPGLTDEEKRGLALAVNEHRRHLSAEDWQELAVRLRQQGLSYRQIGEKLGVSVYTAHADVQAAAVSDLTVDLPERVLGKDGKSHPARVRVESAREAAQAATFLETLGSLPGRTADLTDLRRHARDERRERTREQNRRLVSGTPALGDAVTERFSTVVLDPPWDWGDEGDAEQLGRARPTYATLSLDDITALPIQDLSQANAHLYLWITNRSLPKGFALLERWGFRYVTCLTWVKPSFGMGNYFRGSTEHVLFGVKGTLPLLRRDQGTWLSAERPAGHSAKPEAFYHLVESCSPGPWLELFARQARPGWTVWGAEVSPRA
jgi:N6-adenosine-specific RNA methylase IME4